MARSSDKGQEQKKKLSDSPFSFFVFQSFLILLTLGLGATLLAAVEKKVIEDPHYSLKTDQIVLKNLPDWMASPEELKSGLEFPFGEVSIFKQGLEEDLKSIFQRTHWVQEVLEVQPRLPRDVEISLLPRKPVAKVRIDFQKYLVDPQQVQLPDYAYAQNHELPFIEGIEIPPPGEGNVWDDESLSQALEFLRVWNQKDFLTRYPTIKILKIQCALPREIAAGKPDLTVYLTRRLRLFFDAGDEEGELPPDLALNNFEKILFRDPHLDQLTSYIDLRWKRPTLQ